VNYSVLAKSRASLEETVNTYEIWQKSQEDLTGAKQIFKESASDPELREMAALEVSELEEKIATLEDQLTILSACPGFPSMKRISC
jgi:peptide chain release factor 1